MKTMRQILTIIISFTLLLTWISRVAIANDREYLAPDSARQVPDPNNWPEMYTFGQWYNLGIYGSGAFNIAVKWKADTALIIEASQAITSWKNLDTNLGIEWHPWNNVTSSPDMDIKVGACPSISGALGCVDQSSIIWSSTSTANANRFGQVKIYVDLNNGKTWTSASKRSMIAHEIGHFYGLHERYVHFAGIAFCNNPGQLGANPETTIMDAFNTTNNTVTHCDNLTAPATIESNRINTEFLGQSYTHITATWNSGTSYLNSQWKDFIWEEPAMYMTYWKWIGNSWIIMGNEIAPNITNVNNIAIGVHKDVQDRTIIVNKNVKALWGSGKYRVSAKGWVGTKNNGTPAYTAESYSGSVNVP